MSLNRIQNAIAVPIYNEADSIEQVVSEILSHKTDAEKLILIDDGSNDGTELIFQEWEKCGFFKQHEILAITQPQNTGYGSALIAAFEAALEIPSIEYLLTMDCDRQHQPADIPRFFQAPDAHIVSASRYLQDETAGITPPADRVAINQKITARLIEIAKEILGREWPLTDAFCGMKRYSRLFLTGFLSFYRQLPSEPARLMEGYGFPLPLWTFFLRWAAGAGISLDMAFRELAIARIYITDNRSFGEDLDFPQKRYDYYMRCLEIR